MPVLLDRFSSGWRFRKSEGEELWLILAVILLWWYWWKEVEDGLTVLGILTNTDSILCAYEVVGWVNVIVNYFAAYNDFEIVVFFARLKLYEWI